jgi:hypothetical protein
MASVSRAGISRDRVKNLTFPGRIQRASRHFHFGTRRPRRRRLIIPRDEKEIGADKTVRRSGSRLTNAVSFWRRFTALPMSPRAKIIRRESSRRYLQPSVVI